MSPRSRVTIREVAARAQVSHQTVSRVINGSERVSDETRQRVQEAIVELGYAPNAIARIMAEGRTRTLGCIAPNLVDHTFASIIEGAEAAARASGYFVISASARNADMCRDLIEGLVNSRRIDGLIVINPYADDRHTCLPFGFPMVFVGARPRPDGVDHVALDDCLAGRQATEHLIQFGHRRILHLCGPLSEDCVQDRLTGYQQALQASGLPFDSELVIEGDWSPESGYAAIVQALDVGTVFSAVFAQNDRMAVGAIRRMNEIGLRVPEQISVLGIDDMPLAEYFQPPLTTLRQDVEQSGRSAAKLLIRRLQQPELQPQHQILRADLVLRRSTAQAKLSL